MSNNPFKPATKEKARLRMALLGPSGGGKTYTALVLATALAQGGKVAVIDTEHGSASKYANEFKFDVVDLADYAPRSYINMIAAADQNGYEVLIIDSLSHAWSGKGGVLEMVDRAAKRSNSNNSFTAWRDVTPEHNALIEAMLATKAHIIVTMRSKSEYVLVPNDKGKMEPKRIGLAPVQRDGMEYEFDILAEIDVDHTMVVTKSRCPAFTDMVVAKPGADVADKLRIWLSDGAEPMPKSEPPAPSAPASQPRRTPEPEKPVTRAERSVDDEPADRDAKKETPAAAQELIAMPAGNGDEYDPAMDLTPITAGSWETFGHWLVKNVLPAGKNIGHAGNAVKESLVEAGEITADETEWPKLYGKRVPIAKAYAAIQAHYAAKPQDKAS